MWDNKGHKLSQHNAGEKGAGITRASLQILPCTVSQLLSSTKVDSYVVGGREVSQASIVGIVRRSQPFENYIQYRVDDMTGPPVDVTLWVNTEAADPSLVCDGSPGTYVKVVGTLRGSEGRRSLTAYNIRCLEDLNEITSHMLEVVQAHMLPSERVGGSPWKPVNDKYPSSRLSTIQTEVLHVVSKCCGHEGISLDDIKTKLDYLSLPTIRRSLEFLMKEGNVFTTIDEQHFKSIGSG
ncbi:replication protein A 32 kDa subunit-like isoform X1 [Gadus macrocephalus]|uniref:replication protein A 32 kDa subunit-like isoform X1 n=1 Tax=Gadus macrocephalus TaxID=80720 RepID=UPI0028CB653A|nr:replication protein A 32 kDa subunit-like isoform X1 [Gadus macrocephalus]